jgi:hypothetical protein
MAAINDAPATKYSPCRDRGRIVDEVAQSERKVCVNTYQGRRSEMPNALKEVGQLLPTTTYFVPDETIFLCNLRSGSPLPLIK